MYMNVLYKENKTLRPKSKTSIKCVNTEREMCIRRNLISCNPVKNK